jgi:hypothetical protein
MSDEELKVRIGGDASAGIHVVQDFTTAMRDSLAEISKNTAQAAHGIDSIGEHLSNVKEHAREAGGAFREMGGEIVGEIAKLATELFGLEKIFEGFLAGIEKADEIRDLAASLETFTGSAKSAAESIEFFDEAMGHTRSTGIDLATTYRDLLPIAIRRGFDPEALRAFVVELDQVASVSGKTLPEISSAFEKMLLRAPRGRNALLEALGIAPEDIKTGRAGIEQIEEGVARLAKRGAEMGDTFASASKKAKDELLVAFAEGFNGARQSADAGMAGVVKALTSPEILGALHNLGETIATIGPAIARAFNFALGLVQVTLGTIETIAGNSLLTITTWVTKVEDLIADAIEKASTLRLTVTSGKYGPELSFAKTAPDGAVSDTIASLRRHGQATDIIAGANAMLDQGANAVGAGVKALTGDYEKAAGATEDWNKKMEEMLKHLGGSIAPIADQGKEARKAKEEIEKLTIAWQQKNLTTMQDIAVLQQVSPLNDAELKYVRDLSAISKDAALAMVDIDKAQAVLGSSDGIKALRDNIEKTTVGAKELALMLYQISAEKAFGAIAKKAPGVDTYGDIAPEGGFPGGGATAYRETQAYIALDRSMAEAEFRGHLIDAASDAALKFVQETRSGLSSAFASLAQSGGKNFGEVAARAFSQLVGQGADQLAGILTGLIVGGKPGNASLGQDPSKFYDASGEITDPEKLKRGKALGAGIGAIEIGFGAYNASAQASGQRTAGTIGGAIAGAGLGAELGGSTFAVPGAIIGAVAGAIIGAIGAAVGTAQRQSEYKFGSFGVSSTGMAFGYNRQNMNTQELDSYVAQIQQTYDAFKDSVVHIFLSIPGAIIPKLGAEIANFQPNPSANFEKHLAQWIADGMDRAMLGQLKPDFSKLFAGLGLGSTVFEDYWSRLSKIDPKQMLTLFGELAKALVSLKEVADGFHADEFASIFGAGSHTYEREMGALSIGDHEGYAQQIAKGDAEIVRFAAHIKDLSPEGQIAALGELAQMQKERYQSEKDAIREIFQTLKAALAQFKGDVDSITLQQLAGPDGGPTKAQLDYLQAQAQHELDLIGSSATAADAAAHQAAYRQDILQAAQIGMQLDPTAKQAWLQWEKDALGTGVSALEADLTRLGLSIDDINTAFNSQVDPIIKALTLGVGTATTDIDKLGTAAGGAADPIRRMGDTANDVADQLTAAAARIAATNFGSSSRQDSSAAFMARTSASRTSTLDALS